MKILKVLYVSSLLISLSSCLGSREFNTSGLQEKPGPNSYYKLGNPYQIDGIWYTPKEQPDYNEIGIASWYGPNFHGKETANGDVFDQNALTAAHKTLPMPSMVRVTNIENNRSIILMVNDRGPFSKGRIIDVSKRAAEVLGFQHKGIAKVRVQFLPGQTEKLIANLPRSPKMSISKTSINQQISQLSKPTIAINAQELVEPLRSHLLDEKIELSAEQLKDFSASLKGSDVKATEAPKNWAKSNEPVSQAPNQEVIPEESLEISQPKVEILEEDEEVFSNIKEKITSMPKVEKKYFIQAGSYIHKYNAENVKTNLIDLGNIKIQSHSSDNTMLHRVKLGPVKENMKQYILNRVIGLGHPDAIIVYE